MVKLHFRYLSFFFGLTSILSFFNIIYSYYLNLYLNLDTYYYTLITSLIFSILFFKLKIIEKKPSIFVKILFQYIRFNFTKFLFWNSLRFYIYRFYYFWKYQTYRSKFNSMEIINTMDRWFIFFVFYNISYWYLRRKF